MIRNCFKAAIAVALFGAAGFAVAFVQPVLCADGALVVPVRLRVARCGDRPVQPDSWVKAHVAAAQEILNPHGIRIEAAIDHFEPSKCELTSRADRHGLAKFAEPGRATVLIVKRIQDLDVPSYNLMGVHWRYRGKDSALAGRRWVYLTARAKPPVLAHELCHYFGLRHDLKGGNLMAPGPSDPSRLGQGPKPAPFKPILEPWQVKKLRREIRRHKEHSNE